MINLIKLQCPNCSANLEVRDDAKFCFCTYCGTKIMLANENEHIYRIVDEARIKEVELNHDLELRRMERESGIMASNLEEKKLERDIALAQAYGEYEAKEREKELRKKRHGKTFLKGFLAILASLIIGAILAAVSGFPIWILFSLIGGGYIAFKRIPQAEDRKIYNELGYSIFPKKIGNLKDQDPTLLKMELEEAGFYNIDMKNLHDLKTGLFSSKTEYVEDITVNGRKMARGKLYPSDSLIVIIYHGK